MKTTVLSVCVLLLQYLSSVQAVAYSLNSNSGATTVNGFSVQGRNDGGTNTRYTSSKRGTTSCLSPGSPQLTCSFVNAASSSDCWTMTTDSAFTCLTSTSRYIPNNQPMACCYLPTWGCLVWLNQGSLIGYGTQVGGNSLYNIKDNNKGTFFQSYTTGAWMGYDIGEPVYFTRVGIVPRVGNETALQGAKIQVSNYPDFSVPYTVASLTAPATSTTQQYYYWDLSTIGQFRYIRLISVAEAMVAEFVPLGCPPRAQCNTNLGDSTSSDSPFGSPSSNVGYVRDSSLTSVWTGSAANSYIGVAYGSDYYYEFAQMVITPQSGYASSLEGGIVQVALSSSGPWTDVGTISGISGNSAYTLNLQIPGSYRYARVYWSNAVTTRGVADLRFIGCSSITCTNWIQSPAIAADSSPTTCRTGADFVDPTVAYTVTGSASGSKTNIGSGSLAAGAYLVNYIRGAFATNSQNYVHQQVGSINNTWWVVTTSGSTKLQWLPGTFGTGGYSSAAALQADNVLLSNILYLSSPTAVSIQLIDTDYSNNGCASSDCPTWSFTRLQ